MKLLHYFILTILISLNNNELMAQEMAVIDGYLQEAAKNSPELKASYHRYQAVLEKSDQASSLPDPELGFNFFIMPMERYMGEQVGDVSIMQMFPWVGTQKAGKEEAALMAKMAFEEFQAAKLNLFYEVKVRWYQLYQVEKELALLQEEMQLLDQLKRLAMSKYTSDQGAEGSVGSSPQRSSNSSGSAQSSGSGMAGMGAAPVASSGGSATSKGSNAMGEMSGSSVGGMVDLLLIELQIKELENRILLKKKSAKPIQTAFNQLLGRPATAQINTADLLVPISFSDDWSAATDSLLLQNPMIKMAEWDEQLRHVQEKMVKLMGRPMIGVGLNYMVLRPRQVGEMEMGPMNNGGNMLMPMLTISLPIYRKKYQAQQREVAHLKNAAAHDKQFYVNQFTAELEQIIYDFEEASEMIGLLEEQITITDQAIRLMTTAYSVGKIGMEELIKQRQNMLRYQEQILANVITQHASLASFYKLMAIDI